ncbi:hypothetical protein [Uliginosibacterium gangwonense]|uniref:hypothetical protein n=1 Tax=Uliginosibacterium gangwonense TaxID=392736 RepID=UPI00036AB1AF|nr:hypothetical protein [Uliginosibacterium gangwonense]
MNRSEALHYLRQDRTLILDQETVDSDDQLAEALYLLDPNFGSSVWQGRTARTFLAQLPDITIRYLLSRSNDQNFVIHTAEQAAIQFKNTGEEYQPLLVRVGLRHSVVIAHTVMDTRTSNGVKKIKRGVDANFDQVYAAA